MQPLQPQLAAKLAQYRAVFETSCSGLFGGGVTVTVEMEDESSDVFPAPTAPAAAAGPAAPVRIGPSEPTPGAPLATATESVTKNAPPPVHDPAPSGVPSADAETPSMVERKKAA